MSRDRGPEGPWDLAAIYDRVATSLYRHALMILADPAAAEDVVHDVFAALAGRRVPDVMSIDAYLRQAVRHQCFTRLRRRRWRAPAGTDEPALLEAAPAAAACHDERIAIEQALRSLPPEQREVVHLKTFEGLTFQEIAGVTETSINTVASRYRYAIDKLRVALGRENERPAEKESR
ncbi:MAG TPA: sigma-70 family RNA polymerase sigma factor [Vicinamibacterales bacterium]|jgi:RNA polymerase sigma-70 factor (ECF subfamily)|nr:sigma-70 family RNA polymerase sigma factor [Vicinamibacterales bacterium]